jgi:hypothetical protein
MTLATISSQRSLWAGACNTFERDWTFKYNTLLRPSAWITDNARILTCLLSAYLFWWAISVNSTVRFFSNDCYKYYKDYIKSQILWKNNLKKLTFCTRNITITSQWRLASTEFSAISSITFCSKCTLSWLTQWLAFFFCEAASSRESTYLIASTIRVIGTTGFYTGNQWITLQWTRTFTDCYVTIYLTDSSSTTYCVKTGVYTFMWQTSFIKRTVTINLAIIYKIKQSQFWYNLFILLLNLHW